MPKSKQHTITIAGDIYKLEPKHAKFLAQVAFVLIDPLAVHVRAMIEGGAPLAMLPNGGAVTYRHKIPINGRRRVAGKPTLKCLRKLHCAYCGKYLCDCLCEP